MDKLSEQLPREFALKHPKVYAHLWRLELEVEILTEELEESRASLDKIVSAQIGYLDPDTK